MISWTLTTRPADRPAFLTAYGAECDRRSAATAAAEACRLAFLDARTLTAENGSAPRYAIALAGVNVFAIGLGACRPANFEGALDHLAMFDGSAPFPLYLLWPTDSFD